LLTHCSYGLPALLAFTNPKDMNPWVAVLCIAVYTLGTPLTSLTCMSLGVASLDMLCR